LRVIVDIHEPKEIIEKLERLLVPTMVKSITPGDYIIGDVGIERKSIYDFHQSIIKRRIFEQIARLNEAYGRSILIIEGDLNQLYKERDYRPYIGAIVAITVDLKTPIIFTRNKDETAYALRSIWSRMVKKGEITTIRYKPKILDENERKLFILQGFPDVGPKLAERILLRFRTLKNFFNASIDQLMNVEGIGEKKAEEIYKLINSPYKPKGIKLL